MIVAFDMARHSSIVLQLRIVAINNSSSSVCSPSYSLSLEVVNRLDADPEILGIGPRRLVQSVRLVWARCVRGLFLRVSPAFSSICIARTKRKREKERGREKEREKAAFVSAISCRIFHGNRTPTCDRRPHFSLVSLLVSSRCIETTSKQCTEPCQPRWWSNWLE